MADKHDNYKDHLIEKEDEYFDEYAAFGKPSTLLKETLDVYNRAFSTMNVSALQAAAASFSNGLSAVSKQIQPITTSGLCSKEALSLQESMNQLAESVTPVDSYNTLKGAAVAIKDFAIGLHANAVYMDKTVSAAKEMAKALLETKAVPAHFTQAGILMIAKNLSVQLDICRAAKLISRALTYMIPPSGAFESMLKTIRIMTDRLKTFRDNVYQGFRRFADILFDLLRAPWKRRPKRPALSWHISMKRAAALVNTGLSPPKKVREYAVRIRKIYLQKRQRKGEESDDLNDNFLPVFVTM